MSVTRNAETQHRTASDPTGSADPTRPASDGVPSSYSARERWVLVGASFWLIFGLQLDAFAHATIPDLESFWTPWHAVMYSGIAACGLTLLWLLRSRLPEVVTYRSLLQETPKALRLPVIGMGLLLVGGGFDTLWHNLFGIERGLEIFFSPSHYLIISGMVLVAAGPALMFAASTSPSKRQVRGADAVLLVLSAALASLPLHIYTNHATALEEPMLGTGAVEPETYSLDALMVHGYVGSTVLLVLPLLLLARRWELPVGAPTALTAVPTLAMGLVLGQGEAPWLPITIMVAAAVVELVARTTAPLYQRLTPDTRWVLLGFAGPAVVWGAVLSVGALVGGGVSWNPHMATGIVVLTGLIGAGTAYVVRGLAVSRTAPTR